MKYSSSSIFSWLPPIRAVRTRRGSMRRNLTPAPRERATRRSAPGRRAERARGERAGAERSDAPVDAAPRPQAAGTVVARRERLEAAMRRPHVDRGDDDTRALLAARPLRAARGSAADRRAQVAGIALRVGPVEHSPDAHARLRAPAGREIAAVALEVADARVARRERAAEDPAELLARTREDSVGAA